MRQRLLPHQFVGSTEDLTPTDIAKEIPFEVLIGSGVVEWNYSGKTYLLTLTIDQVYNKGSLDAAPQESEPDCPVQGLATAQAPSED